MKNKEMEKLYNRKIDKVLAWGVVILVVAVIVRWLIFFM